MYRTTEHLPQCWRLATLAVQHAPAVLLHGLPGTGKSYLATSMSEHPSGLDCARDDVYTLTLHEDASAFDIVGGYLPKAGKWDWRDGPAVQAWRASHERPVRLVLNEIDQSGPGVLTALYAILDSPETAALTLPTGETVRPNPANLQVISTMNGEPSDLPAALWDRHTAAVRLDQPHPDSIARLPLEWRSAAEGLTSASARAENRGTTPRDWHALAALTSRGLSMEDASLMVWPEQRANEVRDHLAISAAAPASDNHPHYDEESDPDEDLSAYEEHAQAVARGDRYEYRCGCGNAHDCPPDDDGDVCCPSCGDYDPVDDSRDRAIEYHS